MKKKRDKNPIVYLIVLFFLALAASAVLSIALQVLGFSVELAGALGRIAVGIVLYILMIRHFRPLNNFRGLKVMLPGLIMALYKIPLHYITGGTELGKLTLGVLILGFAPAIFEEVIFRGIFISKLKEKYRSNMTVLLVSSLVFALVHLTNAVAADLISVLFQVFFAFCFGLIFGGIYLCTEDLASVILLHGLIDTMSYIFPGKAVTNLTLVFAVCVILAIAGCYGLYLTAKKGEAE